MVAEHPRDLLHRLDPRAHHPATPFVQPGAGPLWGAVLPERLEELAQQHGADCAQVVLYEVPQAGPLFAGLVRRPFQEQPASLRQERRPALRAERAHFGAAHLIDRVLNSIQDSGHDRRSPRSMKSRCYLRLRFGRRRVKIGAREPADSKTWELQEPRIVASSTLSRLC